MPILYAQRQKYVCVLKLNSECVILKRKGDLNPEGPDCKKKRPMRWRCVRKKSSYLSLQERGLISLSLLLLNSWPVGCDHTSSTPPSRFSHALFIRSAFYRIKIRGLFFLTRKRKHNHYVKTKTTKKQNTPVSWQSLYLRQQSEMDVLYQRSLKVLPQTAPGSRNYYGEEFKAEEIGPGKIRNLPRSLWLQAKAWSPLRAKAQISGVLVFSYSSLSELQRKGPDSETALPDLTWHIPSLVPNVFRLKRCAWAKGKGQEVACTFLSRVIREVSHLISCGSCSLARP